MENFFGMGGSKPKEEDITFVKDFGFSRDQAIDALKQTNNNRTYAIQYAASKYLKDSPMKSK